MTTSTKPGWKFKKGERIIPRPEFVAHTYYAAWGKIPYLLITQLRDGAKSQKYQFFVATRYGLGGDATQLTRGFLEANFISEREALEQLLTAYATKDDVDAGTAAWVIAERLVKDCCAFGSFEELLSAKGDYRPSLYGSESARLLADVYDFVQARRGDARRAYRGSEDVLPRLTVSQ